MQRISSQFETFNDGVISIYDVMDRKIIRAKVKDIRFGNRTVGIQRYWQAKTAGNKVSKLVAIPLSVLSITAIDTQDVVVMENGVSKKEQYQVIQVQEKFDKKPPALYLTLEKIVHPFKLEGM